MQVLKNKDPILTRLFLASTVNCGTCEANVKLEFVDSNPSEENSPFFVHRPESSSCSCTGACSCSLEEFEYIATCANGVVTMDPYSGVVGTDQGQYHMLLTTSVDSSTYNLKK